MPQPLVAHLRATQEVSVLELHQRSANPGVVVHEVVGEVDVASTPALRDELDRVLATSDGLVVLDLTRMAFIDAAGLGALVRFAVAMAALDRSVAVRGVRPFTAHLLEVSGVGRHFALDERS